MVSVSTDESVNQKVITDAIRQRRSIFADAYVDKEIPKCILEEILTNAIWAPTYKMTEPWRFIVLQGAQRRKFGEFMAEYYKNTLPEDQFPPKRYERVKHYPLKAACMIALIMPRNTKVEEWEEIAALSCAVQNMWLSCGAYGIGAYWDTCKACIEYGKELGIEEDERCLGFFYMGYYNTEEKNTQKRRTPITEKVTWLK